MRAGIRRHLSAIVVGGIAMLMFASNHVRSSGPGNRATSAIPAPAKSLGRATGGCKAGTVLVGRSCFDRVSRGPIIGVRAAADRCAQLGGYLPKPSELLQARNRIDLGDGTGSDSQFTEAFFFTSNGHGPMTIVVSSKGQRVVRDEWASSGKVVSNFAFTCVYRR